MAKVKVKTHSGAKKRFKVTGTGKVKYQKTNRRHRLTQKETKRKTSLDSQSGRRGIRIQNLWF